MRSAAKEFSGDASAAPGDLGMASVRLNRLVAAVMAGSMFVVSTTAVASTPATAAPQQVSPWAALAALSAGAPAATLCGAAATAAVAGQAPATGCVLPAVDAPPVVAQGALPPAPLPVVAAPTTYAVSPLFLALATLAAGALVYALVRNHHHTISPA
jgi:hypothetical protein